MWLQMGLSVLKGVAGYMQASREAKYRRAMQEYNNKMVRLSNAQNQNAIVTNQNLAVERSLAQQFEISRQAYVTKGAVEVSAASTDTAGRSVNQTLYQVQRSADEAESRRLADLDAQLATFQQQSKNSAMQGSQQLDYSYIPGPNPAMHLLGGASNLVSIYNQFHPPTIN